jgi:regulatory protein
LVYTYEKALNAMRSLCSREEKCHRDIRTKLIQKGIFGLELENIIATLIEENYLNEERYARAFVRGKFRNNSWGKIKIISGLRQKGISDYCIKKGMEEISDDEYKEKVLLLIDKKRKLLNDLNPVVEKKKITQVYGIERI